MLDSLLENSFELIAWLICQVFFEFILINLIKLVWSLLEPCCWAMGATLIFLFTFGSIGASAKQQVKFSSQKRHLERCDRNQKKCLEYNTVVFLGALSLTAFVTVLLLPKLS